MILCQHQCTLRKQNAPQANYEIWHTQISIQTRFGFQNFYDSSAFSESANRKYLARQNPKTKLIVCFVQGYNTMVKRLAVTQEVTPIDPFFLSSFLSLLGGEDPIYSNHWPMPWKVFPNQFAKCCLR